MKLKRGELIVVIFNLIYILAFAFYYTFIGNYEFLVYISAIVILGLILVSNLHKITIDYLALWGLSIWGLLHMLGGGLKINGHTLYSQRIIHLFDGGGDFFILKMDQFIHFYGFAVAAILVFQLLAPNFKNVEKSKLAIFIAWIGSMGLGALNEVIEFIAFVSLTQTGVGDLYNTGLDLIFNMLGAFAGSFIAFYWHRRKLKNK